MGCTTSSQTGKATIATKSKAQQQGRINKPKGTAQKMTIATKPKSTTVHTGQASKKAFRFRIKASASSGNSSTGGCGTADEFSGGTTTTTGTTSTSCEFSRGGTTTTTTSSNIGGGTTMFDQMNSNFRKNWGQIVVIDQT